MKQSELENNELIKEWFSIMEAAPNTRRNYLKGMALYTDFTGKTPEQLLEEAESEIKSGLLMRKRSIRKYLLDFREMLKAREYAPKTTINYVGTIKSFYKVFDIDLPVLNRRKTFQAKPTEKNMFELKKEHIQEALKHADVRNRAIILAIVSSGLGQSDILNLRVGKFKEGYDEKTGITTLKIRRIKTRYDFYTFFSPEASQAIWDYIEWRTREPKRTWHPDIMEAYEKRRIRSDDDYLFIKHAIGDEYLKTLDDEDRRFKTSGLMEMFRETAKRMGMESDKGQWQYFRAHNLRKFFNSTLLNNGADIFFTDYLMGHVIDQTHEAYFQASPEKLRERYMRFVPFLSIESVETRVLESEAYEKLHTEYEGLKKRLAELEEKEKYRAEALPKDILNELFSDDEFKAVLEKKLWKMAQAKKMEA